MEVIFQALRNLNEERDPSEQFVVDANTRLFGSDSDLDSLALVSVIVDVETLVEDRFGHRVSLTDDNAMSRDPVPFVSVAALKSYILEQLSGV